MRPKLRFVPVVLLAASPFPLAAWAANFDCVIQPRQVVEIRSLVEGLLDRIHQ